jgi:uncharacterized repeat protein (TIGR01451 family)
MIGRFPQMLRVYLSLLLILVAACPAFAQLSADLAITKTDGVTTATPGGSVTYTITASNAGPDVAPGATLADTFPAVLTCTWTCVGAGGGTCTAAGSGNISDTVNLPAGGSVTYTASCSISASATGTLSNTATVAAPAGVTDPTPGNNSATDTDTLSTQADLGITKTDGVTTATPGGSVTYTITASNAGPSTAPGATVADTFPAALSCTWACVGAGGGICTAAGSGNISDTVNLPAGGSVTYTASCSISASATGTLSNTATVAAPAGVTDPTPGNNSATDTDTLSAQADLRITKTDGVTTATPGGSVTYTITASNAGPSNAPAATVADTFPASLTCTWTCVGAGGGICTAAGSGNVNDVVNLPAGGSVTHTASCTVSPGATGTLSNTATVSPPAGVTDPIPANNSATDTDTLNPLPVANVSGTMTVSGTFTGGGSVTYTVVLTNSGTAVQGDNPGDEFTDVLPRNTLALVSASATSGTAVAFIQQIERVTWNGSIPAGGSVTVTIHATIRPTAVGATVSNQGTIAFDNDGNGTNERSVQTDDPGKPGGADPTTFTVPLPDLAITKTDGVTTAVPGGSVTYTIVASNAGTSEVVAKVVDTFPAALTCTWTCAGASTFACKASGAGNIDDNAFLPVGGSVIYTASCTIAPSARGSLSNTATVSALVVQGTDPNPGNNTATDTDMLTVRGGCDVNGDGRDEIVTGAGPGGRPHVRVLNLSTGVELASFYAYDPDFGGGVSVACGDVDGDARADIVTGAGHGGGPHVRVFSLAGGLTEVASFYAYDPTFTGGVRVAAGDVDGDGRAEIVTGAGPGSGPHVRVFNLAGGLTEVATFYAYDPTFTGGVFVATGDVTGDGRADIVTGAGAGGGPQVRAFDLAGGGPSEVASFSAYDPTFRGDVTVALGDLTGDGVAEIVTGAGAGGGPHVRVVNLAGGLTEVASFYAYDPTFTGGVFVAVGDVTGDGVADLITGAGAGGGPHVRVFDGVTGAEVATFFAYDPAFTAGVFVGAGS